MAAQVLQLPELLSQIFTHCQSLPNSTNSIHVHPNALPLSLARVSKTWRSTALSTPQLFATLSLSLKPSDASYYLFSPQSHLRLLEWWLKHSGALPLNIFLELDLDQDAYKPDSFQAGPFIDAISKHAHRWRTLTLKAPGDDLAAFTALTLPRVSLNAPLLKVLTLAETTPATRPAPAPKEPVERIESKFPSLKSLSLSRISTASLLPSLLRVLAHIPTEQITSFCLVPHFARPSAQLSASDALQLLSLFPDLARLTLSVSDLRDSTHSPLAVDVPEMVTLKHLTHLSLNGHPTPISSLFSHLTLPSLAFILSRYPADDLEDEGFLSCLERSGRMVREKDDWEEDSWGESERGVVEIVERI